MSKIPFCISGGALRNVSLAIAGPHFSTAVPAASWRGVSARTRARCSLQRHWGGGGLLMGASSASCSGAAALRDKGKGAGMMLVAPDLTSFPAGHFSAGFAGWCRRPPCSSSGVSPAWQQRAPRCRFSGHSQAASLAFFFLFFNRCGNINAAFSRVILAQTKNKQAKTCKPYLDGDFKKQTFGESCILFLGRGLGSGCPAAAHRLAKACPHSCPVQVFPCRNLGGRRSHQQR